MSVSCAVVQGLGGWNLRVDTSTCPDSAPVNCGTGLQIRCCPSGHTCAGGSTNICCPTGTSCAGSIYNTALCADPTWNLWQKPGNISSSNGAWCCEPGYTGLYTSGGVMCLAAGSVPSSASVAIQTTQTSTCSTSSTHTATSSSSSSATSTSSAATVTSATSTASSASSAGQASNTSSPSAPNAKSSSSTSTLGIGLGVALGVLAIILGVVAFMLYRRRKRSNQRHMDDQGSKEPWLGHSPPAQLDAESYRDNKGTTKEAKSRSGGIVELNGSNNDHGERHELEAARHANAWTPPVRSELE